MLYLNSPSIWIGFTRVVDVKVHLVKLDKTETSTSKRFDLVWLNWQVRILLGYLNWLNGTFLCVKVIYSPLRWFLRQNLLLNMSSCAFSISIWSDSQRARSWICSTDSQIFQSLTFVLNPLYCSVATWIQPEFSEFCRAKKKRLLGECGASPMSRGSIGREIHRIS